MTTPPLLLQKWQSHGKHSRISSLTVFSQPAIHVFSNYITHPPVALVVPPYCHSADLANSGRCTHLAFRFAEMAIMACKAALFRDYSTFDKIMRSKNWREAKALGRQVSRFDQDVWDAHQCSIVRDVTIAKLDWTTFRSALLQTGDDLIAECTFGDWVWGTALRSSDGDVFYPGRWKGINILGWSLMEARDEARRQQQRQHGQQQQQQHQQHQLLQQQQQQFAPMPSAPPMEFTSSSSNTSIETPKRQRLGSKDQKINPNSIKYLATRYSFGPNALGPLQRAAPVHNNATNSPDLSHSVKGIVESSVPEAKHMRGERGNKYVTRMLTDVYRQGLFMHGNPDSSVNRTVIPAFRHVIGEMNKLDAQDKKRISMVRNLVEACQDCQQVQARIILRMYGDLTCQNETLDSQLKYSLVPSKEAALQILITRYHSPSCDYDYTKVGSESQRAHLLSGYVALIGDAFGLDGVGAANGDRFLDACLGVIRNVHHGRSSSSAMRGVGLIGDDPLKRSLLDELTNDLCVKEWLSGLISDINNQSANADRRIDRSCIFSWAAANTDGDFKHRIFYDEARVEEYSDLDPKGPTDDNKFEPFLNPIVLVEMLVKAGMLKRKI